MLLALMAVAQVAAAPPATTPYRTLVPIGDQRSWFLPRDYPAAAIAERAEGAVRFSVDIDTAGRPSACRIVKGSGNAALDAATCRALMARARFHPVTDRRGRPRTALFEQSVTWHLPATTSEQIDDRTFAAHSVIAPGGAVVACTMSGTGSVRFGGKGNACGPFGERGFLAGAMGADYAKARTADIRLQVSYEGQPDSAGPTPDFYLLLAEAEMVIRPDATMGKCTSIRPLAVQGRSVDLCSIVAASPPRFGPAAAGKRAVFVLDLSASYR